MTAPIHEKFTIGTGSLKITPGLDAGYDITIQHVGTTGYVYIGGVGVTSSNYGYRLSAGQAFSVELSGNNDLYIVGSEAINVAVLRLNLEAGK
jgi:uncharacterized protein YjdB